MATITDFKLRVSQGKRIYAFFHILAKEEPLAFIEVLLTNHISSNMKEVLKETPIASTDVTTAIFYAINSTQKGLSGIDVGNRLIKRVVHELKKEFKNIKIFCTFSPVPGFRNWLLSKLNQKLSTKAGIENFLTSDEQKNLQSLNLTNDAYTSLEKILQNSLWVQYPIELVVKNILLRLCVRYLILEKYNTYAIDPVANFHLQNGAILERINWNADESDIRKQQSFGIMVNYKYILEDLESNIDKYKISKIVSCSSEIKCILPIAKL